MSDLSPYKNSLAKGKQSNKSLINPVRMREGWDKAHGMLDLNKQS
jgi:hypothetical protein